MANDQGPAPAAGEGTPPGEKKILEVEKLYKFYTMGGVEYPVLKEIDLAVKRGTFVVIM